MPYIPRKHSERRIEMQAIVVENVDGKVSVRVRRGYVIETLQGRHDDLKRGDKVECKRQTNNPYVIRVKEENC